MTTCHHTPCTTLAVTTFGPNALCLEHYRHLVWPIYRKVAANGGVNPYTGGRMYPPLPVGTLIGIGVYNGPTTNDHRSHLVCDVCGHRFVGRTFGEPCPECVWHGLVTSC